MGEETDLFLIIRGGINKVSKFKVKNEIEDIVIDDLEEAHGKWGSCLKKFTNCKILKIKSENVYLDFPEIDMG